MTVPCYVCEKLSYKEAVLVCPELNTKVGGVVQLETLSNSTWNRQILVVLTLEEEIRARNVTLTVVLLGEFLVAAVVLLGEFLVVAVILLGEFLVVAVVLLGEFLVVAVVLLGESDRGKITGHKVADRPIEQTRWTGEAGSRVVTVRPARQER
ncbi:hypothetical protein PoB_002524100 [Plakobranchus ocellatus]|uniref:Uncharacterized protein n=1 Tax=Plakobranchus ocellatus TaxID=259542 RepID=A0AAV3ZHX5_9GAST|nr:hypothetical protein PoB_002524100 [Plakobranchus ocellatus]